MMKCDAKNLINCLLSRMDLARYLVKFTDPDLAGSGVLGSCKDMDPVRCKTYGSGEPHNTQNTNYQLCANQQQSSIEHLILYAFRRYIMKTQQTKMLNSTDNFYDQTDMSARE